jgi:glycosyltransferase involved in cell wall biosynthesis
MPIPASGGRLLFVVGTVYLPDDLTGANRSLDALCLRLVALGFEPVVVCVGQPDEPPPDDPRPESAYIVERVADPVESMPALIRRHRPRAIVARGPEPALRLLRAGLPWLQPLHVIFTSDFTGHAFPSPREAAALRCAANSPFLARMAAAYFAAEIALVPSVIEPEAYRVEAAGDAVLFVNPIAVKGVYIAAAIAARLPHRRFLFVRTWADETAHPVVDPGLPNVEMIERTRDMRGLYARARLVLVPSVWEESSARVIGEAQVSGIPAVTSDRGGLRDSVGRGGVVLPIDAPIERWCDAVETMFTNGARYAAYAEGARAHAARRDFTPESAVGRFLQFCGLNRPASRR